MHPDGPSPVVPFIYDMGKKELKVASGKDNPVHRTSPFLAAVNGTLARFNEYIMQSNMITSCTIFAAISEIMRSDYL